VSQHENCEENYNITTEETAHRKDFIKKYHIPNIEKRSSSKTKGMHEISLFVLDPCQEKKHAQRHEKPRSEESYKAFKIDRHPL
jgi:desulfoferrodoxin (superoxide reductase-like protein)